MSDYTDSRNEEMIKAIINETEYSSDYTQGQNEEILQSIINGTEYTKTPNSRMAALLLELKAKIEEGGGSTLEEKSIAPNFSSGDVVLTPDEGYDGFSQVTIEKDTDLIASNIKKDVNIFGVTGSYEVVDTQFKDLVERNISSVSDNTVTKVSDYVFYYCTSLTSVSLPNASSIGEYAFYYCTSLTSISLPNASSIGNYAFQKCTSLTSVSLPNASSIGYYAFQQCSKLTSISLPNASSIKEYAFYSCTKLTTLIIRTSEVCVLNSINVFQYTPFASGKAGGALYVPQALIASYQANTTWNSLLTGNANNQILPIEGSIYE